MSERFVLLEHPRVVTWTRDGARWGAARRVQDGKAVVEVTRDGAVVATLQLGELWDLLDAVGLLFDGAVGTPPTAAPAKDRPPQAGARWTPADDDALAEAWAEGATIAELAADCDRTTGAIVARLVHLDLCADRDAARDEDRRRRG
jgi:hypothetical protein